MKTNIYSSIILLSLLIIPSQLLFAQNAQPDKERISSEEVVEPLFGREKLEKIKEVKSFHKSLKSLINKYNRCLFTGPCTKKEMQETYRDIKRMIIGILVIIGGSIILRLQYKRVQESGEEPIWYKFPVQYYRLRKRQAQALGAKVKKGAEAAEKIMTTAEQIAEGKAGVSVPVVGEIKIKKEQPESASNKEPIAPTWSQWGWSWLGYPIEQPSSASETKPEAQPAATSPQSVPQPAAQPEKQKPQGWSEWGWSWLGY